MENKIMNIKKLLFLGLLISSATLNIFSAEKSLPSLTLPDSASDSAGEARWSDTKEETETCPICLENKTESDDLYKLGCNHDFHKSCIKTWVNENNKSNCPLCRVDLSPKNLRELGNSAADLRSLPRRGANDRQIILDYHSIISNGLKRQNHRPQDLPIQVGRIPHTHFYSHNRSRPPYSELLQASHHQGSRSGIAHDNPYLRDRSNNPLNIRRAQYDREHPVTIQDLITNGTAPAVNTRMFPGEADLSFFNRITSLEGIQNIPRKEEVTVLSFLTSSLRLESIPAYAFTAFQNLKKLSIHRSTLKKINAHAFDGLPHLKEIDIQYNGQLIYIEPGAFTNVAPHLEIVDLKNNPLSAEVKRRVYNEIHAHSPQDTLILFSPPQRR